MRKILRFSGGHLLDIDPAEVAEQYLSRAHNVHTRKGFPSRIGGYRDAYPGLPNDPFHILNVELNTFNWWISFGTDSIYAAEGTNFHDITFPSMQTIDNPSEWSSTLLNGIPAFVNGKDSAMYWNGQGATPAAALPDWPASTTAKFIVAFKFHLFAMNIDGPSGVFDNLILWSDAAEPGDIPASWTPGANNEAGSAFAADTPGRCICGVPLNTMLAVYKPWSIYGIEYVGQPPNNIFSIRSLIRTVGALGPACVIDWGTQHLIVGNDDVVLFDGLNARSIAENRIKRYLSNSLDETYAHNTFVVRDLNKRETWICVPESGNQFATVAHIWDERRDAWTTRDLVQARHGAVGYVTDTTEDSTWDADNDTWDTDNTVWNQGSIASISRVVLALEESLQVNDVATSVEVTGSFAKYDMSLDDDSQSKLIQSVQIAGTGLGFASARFRMGARDSTDSPISWNAFKEIDVIGHPVDYEISGRYISIAVEITSDQDWTVNRIIIEFRPNGTY